jgi:sphingolipid delta-4 desaturase
MAAPSSFTVTAASEPHRVRTRQIIRAHPEVKQLMTRTPATFWIGLGCVLAQVGLAAALRNQAW